MVRWCVELCEYNVSGGYPEIIVAHCRRIVDIVRSINEQVFARHLTVDVDADECVVSGQFRCLSEYGYSFEMLGQSSPGFHLGIGELLVCPGNV